MAVQFSDDLINGLLAPGAGQFQVAHVPDLRGVFDQEDHWLTNLFLNSAVGPRYRAQGHQAAVTLIFRTQSALRAYHRARLATMATIAAFSPGRPSIKDYYEAVAEWEVVVLNLQIAFDMILKYFDPAAKLAPDVERLRSVANRVKHYAEDVAKAKASAGLVLPLWMSSQGLETSAAAVSYDEIAQMLRELANAADQFQQPKPLKSTP